MKNLERRDELRRIIAAKQAEVTDLLAIPRSSSVRQLLFHASSLLTGADRNMGNSVDSFDYPGVDEYEEHLFGGVDLFIRAASFQVARVVSAINEFGPDTEVL